MPKRLCELDIETFASTSVISPLRLPLVISARFLELFGSRFDAQRYGFDSSRVAASVHFAARLGRLGSQLDQIGDPENLERRWHVRAASNADATDANGAVTMCNQRKKAGGLQKNFYLAAMAPIDLSQLIAASARRLQEVQTIADSLRHDSDLHRLAMTAVFVLEDCHEGFRQLQDEAATRE